MTKEDSRPDPDLLLQAVKAEEAPAGRGRLRIFLGMSAGVGKTFAMLRAARQRQGEGIDVVVGIVETHGRSETAALLEGLPVLPRRRIPHRGAALEEMDLDAILRRRPELVLVDELAHSNAPGSRHPKRYQDVLELLEAGIDVATTLNVQHLESRKDSVEAITGVAIRETVPDSILEKASLVELVDIAPSELLKRLREGKVYLGDKAESAARNFFKEDHLTALREMALRLTAERVDQDLQRFAGHRGAGRPWRTNERLMVAVSHSPYSEKLIRATRRLAFRLEAPWIAVHVDDGVRLSEADQAQLSQNIQLARRLKAEVITTADADLSGALRRVARQKDVTQIIVGRPTPRWLRDRLQGSLLDQLVAENDEVDVHVLQPEERASAGRPFWKRWRGESGPAAYWNALCVLFGISFIGGLLEPVLGYQAVGFVFLLAGLFAGSLLSWGPALFIAAGSALVWNFFFIPPRLTFAISAPEDVLMCLTYFLVALITGSLTRRARRHEILTRVREERTNALFEISQDIAGSRDKNEFLAKVSERVGRLLDGECGVLLRDRAGQLAWERSAPYSPVLNEKESAVAVWAFSKGQAAGWSTETLPESRTLSLPLVGTSETLGVFVYRPRRPRKLDLEQENLLHSIVRQLAVSLERHFYESRLREAQRLEESEKLHQTLLNSISHEMRTPLTTVIGSATALADDGTRRDPEAVRSLAVELLKAGDRLNRVIENLLDMSRLNSGVLALQREPHDLRDLVGVTLQRLGANLAQHPLRVEGGEDLPLVPLDFRFMEHALSNLILNATQYTPPGTRIRVSLHRSAPAWVELRVEDEGPGVPAESLPRIFDKFYRVPGTPAGGTGLGLSIVRSIVEAHQGDVRVENVSPHGVRFIVRLPLDERLTQEVP
ncbi:MAG: sensor histidine kinase KdpD [Bdellovibrionaceae bacterium]|nr:sensor histidine kinase KdpD [Pseudobdellovibrionaceae bacterium]